MLNNRRKESRFSRYHQQQIKAALNMTVGFMAPQPGMGSRDKALTLVCMHSQDTGFPLLMAFDLNKDKGFTIKGNNIQFAATKPAISVQNPVSPPQ